MYDFDDPLIRDMVEGCHLPTEVVIQSGTGTQVTDVMCEKDHQPWPCEAISGLRQWHANQNPQNL